MIHSFSFSNFYSFKETNTVSFAVGAQAPKNDGYFPTPSGKRLSKLEAVIGPNASGKTNLLKVLPFIKWLITDSFVDDPSSEIPLKSFALPDKNKPSELSATFEIKGVIYSHYFKLTSERILKEKLTVKSQSVKRVTTKTLIERSWNKKTQKYQIKDLDFKLPAGVSSDQWRANSSLIATGIRFGHKQSLEVSDFWQHVHTNVVEEGWTGNPFASRTKPETNLRLALQAYRENPELKAQAERLLSKFDLGLESFSIDLGIKDGKPSLTAQATHTFDGHRQVLPFSYESSGTQQLFILLKSILLVLNHGGLAVLDEFDVNLHPDMLSELIGMFIHPETNPLNAQVLLSSQNHLFLNSVDKYQVLLVEKDKAGSSEVWRLDSLGKEVRQEDNYLSKYLSGAYGAIPKFD